MLFLQLHLKTLCLNLLVGLIKIIQLICLIVSSVLRHQELFATGVNTVCLVSTCCFPCFILLPAHLHQTSARSSLLLLSCCHSPLFSPAFTCFFHLNLCVDLQPVYDLPYCFAFMDLLPKRTDPRCQHLSLFFELLIKLHLPGNLNNGFCFLS